MTAFTVSAAGSGFSKTTGAATATGGGQAGSGTGFTVNITQVVESFSLLAKQTLVWTLATDTIAKLPFTCDVSKMFVSNASGSTANVKIRSLSNV